MLQEPRKSQSPPAGDRAPVPQAAGCAVYPAGRWPITRQVALNPKLSGGSQKRRTRHAGAYHPGHNSIPRPFIPLPDLRRPSRAFQRSPNLLSQACPADQNSPPSRIRRLEETGGLEPNPKPNLLLVAIGSGLIASKQKASSQAQPKIAPAWSTRVEETNEKTGARETSSGGNWGPPANPKSKPCARLAWTGATSSRQVSSQYFNPKPNLLLVWSGRCNWLKP